MLASSPSGSFHYIYIAPPQFHELWAQSLQAVDEHIEHLAADGWVVVQIDNGSPQESLLRPGERAHWKGQDQFILTLGNAGGVKAELNGKPQKPFGPSGKVARDIVLKR